MTRQTFQYAAALSLLLCILGPIDGMATDAACPTVPPETGYQPKTGGVWCTQSATYWGHYPAPEKAECAAPEKTKQSPIDLRPGNATNTGLRRIRFHYRSRADELGANTNAAWQNNGHTIGVLLNPDSYAADRSIRVDGKTFKLDNIHVHHPSEHLLNGQRYAMEVHLVHKAVPPATGAVVVAVFLIPGGSSSDGLQKLFAQMAATKAPNSAVFAPALTEVDLLGLLPTWDMGYVRYDGSLTTPPCTEGVTWLVLKTARLISQQQIDAFTAAYPVNARPLQLLGDRTATQSGTFRIMSNGGATYCSFTAPPGGNRFFCWYLWNNTFSQGDYSEETKSGGLMGDINGDGTPDYCLLDGTFKCLLVLDSGTSTPYDYGQVDFGSEPTFSPT